MRILIVDDEMAHVEAICRAFKIAGPDYEVDVVYNLREFREAVAALPPDLAILDLYLPDGRAVDALTYPPEANAFPVLVMTSFGNEQVAVEAMKAGALDYLVKSSETFAAMPRFVVRAMREWELLMSRKQAEEALLKSEEKFRQLFGQFNALLNALPDSITLHTPDFNFLWANYSAAIRFNKKPEEIVGLNCHNLRLVNTVPCECCIVTESFRTGESATETITSPDGRIIELRTVPIVEEGRVVNVIEVGRDITAHRKLEAQYLHAQKMDSLGTFAAGISHDFNNILTAIIGYGQLALMRITEGDPQHYCIEQILAAADRAAHLTEDLLLFSRKQTCKRQNVNLNSIIAKMETFLKCVLYEDIEYKTILLDGVITINANSYQIEQILINLATNARDAMPHGGTFTISTKLADMDDDYIKVHGYGKPGSYVLVEVSDSGVGMDSEMCKRIFEPFYTTKEVGKGTGLGLSIVYGIIKEHDGFVNVCSTPGIGTSYTIYLPLAVPESRGEGALPEEDIFLGGTETILIAEDCDLVRNISEIVLKESGYTVITAVDGEDALKKFAENKEVIDLLIFDLIMPNMNGIESYNEIKRIRPDVKAIFSSGYEHGVARQKELLVDDRPMIFKPTTPEELLRKVRSVLDGTIS